MTKVGDTIYRFDLNHRVYREPGKFGGGGPIYAEHFRPYVITGETVKSWLVREVAWKDTKINKNTMLESGRDGATRWFTEAGREAAMWKEHHVHRLVGHVQQCSDLATLKQVAALVGYDPDKS